MLEGNMHLARGNEPLARAAYEKAFTVAHELGSPWAELRGLVGVCELSNATVEDFQRLDGALSRFTEGGDLWLSIRARELLDRRSSASMSA